MLKPLLLTASLAVATGSPTEAQAPAAYKRVSFAILEDYDKGADLREVAQDFAAMKALGVTTWRGSFGWDDYEPEPGRYDFDWLVRFVRLAADSGIDLRPYLAYTPEWAGAGGGADGAAWNDPPRDPAQFAAFADTLARTLRRFRNVKSYEIYNEENVPQWWEGTADAYALTLAAAARAIRAANPDAQVILGGFVWPDAKWLGTICDEHQLGRTFAIAPFHAYPETWTPPDVRVENYLSGEYRSEYLPTLHRACNNQPVWINELGYATTPGRSEAAQADWWVRAFGTFLADSAISHLGIYELKDLPPDQPVIGDAPNYHLGLMHVDRKPKLAYRTVQMLVRLMGPEKRIRVDRSRIVDIINGDSAALHASAFDRPDGIRVAFVWIERGQARVRIDPPAGTTRMTTYDLDGTPKQLPAAAPLTRAIQAGTPLIVEFRK